MDRRAFIRIALFGVAAVSVQTIAPAHAWETYCGYRYRGNCRPGRHPKPVIRDHRKGRK